MSKLSGWIDASAWAYQPAPLEFPSLEVVRAAPKVRRGQVLSLMCWNIQYAASRRHHFFYDGGRAAHVPRTDVEETLVGMGQLIQRLNPDFLLVQEVDRGSARTHFLDELHALSRAFSPAYGVSVPYHRVTFLPMPLHQMLGRVELQLAILSRFVLQRPQRVQLALLDEPVWRQHFNLKRCILGVELPLDEGGALRLGCTHLSAFSRGDGTMARQVRQVASWLEQGPGLMGGDFNLLPIGDDPARLEVEADLYADAENPLALLADPFASVPARSSWLEPGWRTYLPFGHAVPDRLLDYCFYTPEVEVLEARVVTEASALSDHLPLWLRFRIRA